MSEDRRKNAHAIPLTAALLCGDLSCQTVWNGRLARACPACGFTVSVPLAVVLNRRRPTLVRS